MVFQLLFSFKNKKLLGIGGSFSVCILAFYILINRLFHMHHSVYRRSRCCFIIPFPSLTAEQEEETGLDLGHKRTEYRCKLFCFLSFFFSFFLSLCCCCCCCHLHSSMKANLHVTLTCNCLPLVISCSTRTLL